MRLTLTFILISILAVQLCCGAQHNTTRKAHRKTLRQVKALKKHKPKNTKDQIKSGSFHVPLIVSGPAADIPISVEVHDDNRHIHSSPDIHPIQPINLFAVDRRQHGPDNFPYSYGEAAVSNRKVFPGEYYFEQQYGSDLSAIPGSPGIDYPTYTHLPSTGFKCLHHTSTPGFYADIETKCQMWHYCQPDGRHDRFLCPNGTLFDQTTRVCNWWFNVHCEHSIDHYDINFDLYREPLRKTVSQALDTPYLETPSVSRPNSYLRHIEEYEAPAPVHKIVSPVLEPSTIPRPNSFLRHVEEFEAAHYPKLDIPQGIIEASHSVHATASPEVYPYRDPSPDASYEQYSNPALDDSYIKSRHSSKVRDSYSDPNAVYQYPIDGRSVPIRHSDRGYNSGNRHHHRYREPDRADDLQQPVIDEGYIKFGQRYPSKMAPAPSVRHDVDVPIDYDSSNAHSISTSKDNVVKHLNAGTASQTLPKKRKRIPRRKLKKLHPKVKAKNVDEVAVFREEKPTQVPRRYRVVKRRRILKE